ncbi:prion-inhibition and propagation-domain-containing protein [Cercophora scortea]|uniref:Prion-inhibition and propagation-domain-containing protein n=1 Tax=Cercophora scortea TaxID=314031 RepID=A0AAE0IWW8_9PEZI|nr:prion-inhibition and propagation-domain-containing protein [Cercophora scortea]
MAEIFGVASGAISIVSTFSTCLEIFEHVQLGRNFGRDYQRFQLKLTVLRLRLSRWGEAVGIYDDPPFGSLNQMQPPDEAEIQAAKDLLLQMLVLMEKSSKIGDDTESGTLPAADSQADMATLAVNNKMKAIAAKRQKRAGFTKLTSWAIHHNNSLTTLINNISELLSNLESLFPLPPTAQASLVQQEIAQIRSRDGIRELELASEGLDEVLHNAVTRVQGHQYCDIQVEGEENISVVNGNLYATGYTGGSSRSGAFHLYAGVRIKGTRNVKVFNGEIYGGNGLF